MDQELTNPVSGEERAEVDVKELKNKVQEVVDILDENVRKLAEREGRLSHLERKGASLVRKTDEFRKVSRKVYIKELCKKRKCCLLLIGGCVLLTTVIVIVVLFATHVLGV